MQFSWCVWLAIVLHWIWPNSFTGVKHECAFICVCVCVCWRQTQSSQPSFGHLVWTTHKSPHNTWGHSKIFVSLRIYRKFGLTFECTQQVTYTHTNKNTKSLTSNYNIYWQTHISYANRYSYLHTWCNHNVLKYKIESF